MPAKKKTTKKATKKTTAKKQEVKKLDLSQPLHELGQTIEERQLVTAHLYQLKSNVGWKILEQVMDDNLQVLASQIVDKVKSDGTVLTDAEVDELRIQHAQIKQLKAMPDVLIEQFKPREAGQEIQYDPYSGMGIGASVLSEEETVSDTT